MVGEAEGAIVLQPLHTVPRTWPGWDVVKGVAIRVEHVQVPVEVQVD